MKKIAWVLMVFMTLSMTHLHGQDTEFRIGYLGGQVSHPGVRLGLGHLLLGKGMYKYDKEKDKNRTRMNQIMLQGDAGAYYHRRYHTGLRIGGGAAWRNIVARNSLFFEVSLSVGALATWIPGVYEVNANGDVGERQTDMRLHFAPEIAIATGGKFKQKDGSRPMGFYSRPSLMPVFPYFESGTMYFFLEAGLIIDLIFA